MTAKIRWGPPLAVLALGGLCVGGALALLVGGLLVMAAPMTGALVLSGGVVALALALGLVVLALGGGV